jgi:purine-cytosine permease-like protein
MGIKKRIRKKLKSFIPHEHIATWKLIAEFALAIIVIVGVLEVAHYFFHVSFSEEFLLALELIDYAAIIILAVDLLHHYYVTHDKPKFLKDKFIYILSFLPYLIFHKAVGVIQLLKPLKPVFTGIAKVIKLFFHKEEIKERVEDVSEELTKPKKNKIKGKS